MFDVFEPKGRAFLEPAAHSGNPADAAVMILPVPFEATSTFGSGSHRGPSAILSVSTELELFDAVLGREPYLDCGGIATLRPLDVADHTGKSLCDRLSKEVNTWLAQGKFVITLGGEHTSVVGAIHAHCEFFEDLTVLTVDAHSDLRDTYLNDPWNHACAMARVLDFHDAMVQVGVRSQDRSERVRAESAGLPIFYARRIHECEAKGDDWMAEVIGAMRKRVYISFDCDALDPAILPATGTPEPDGLTWHQVDGLLARLCLEREVVGFDVAELAPVEGLLHPQFTIAKLIYRFIGRRFPAA